MPASGVLGAQNSGEGFQSIGWRFAAEHVFDRTKLLPLLTGLPVERMKAVFITHDGIFGYNLAEGALSEIPLDECMESRIECIARELDNSLESALLACVRSKH